MRVDRIPIFVPPQSSDLRGVKVFGLHTIDFSGVVNHRFRLGFCSRIGIEVFREFEFRQSFELGFRVSQGLGQFRTLAVLGFIIDLFLVDVGWLVELNSPVV